MEIRMRQQTWIQSGVKRVVKLIPGKDERGILDPKLLKLMQEGAKEGQEEADGQIMEQEIFIDALDRRIPVTVLCKEGKKENRAALVYFHGGGFRTGSRKDVHALLRRLCGLADAVIFNVEYRLAPSYWYPCATDDAFESVKYIYRHAECFGIDREKIAVSGDSAGGNLAAACSRRDRNFRTKMIRMQLLIYPVLALFDPEGMPGYSYSLDAYEYDDKYRNLIEPHIEGMRRMLTEWNLYTKTAEEAQLPDVSPLKEKHFGAFPKTVIYCAQYDYITQQCRTYANYLARDGVDTSLVIYMGTMHGFLNAYGLCDQTEDLIVEMAKALMDMKGEKSHEGIDS